MKLSHLQRAFTLAMERRNLALQIDDMENDCEIEVAVCGWPVAASDEVAGMLITDAITAARNQVAEVERELGALGVDLDIPLDGYAGRTRLDGCGDPMCQTCNPLDAETDEDAELEDA